LNLDNNNKTNIEAIVNIAILIIDILILNKKLLINKQSFTQLNKYNKMNILSTILIITILIFLFLLIFLKNVDEDNEIEIYQLNSKLKECETSLDNKIKQYERYRILINEIKN
jgi:cell division protein FtsL